MERRADVSQPLLSIPLRILIAAGAESDGARGGDDIRGLMMVPGGIILLLLMNEMISAALCYCCCILYDITIHAL